MADHSTSTSKLRPDEECRHNVEVRDGDAEVVEYAATYRRAPLTSARAAITEMRIDSGQDLGA